MKTVDISGFGGSYEAGCQKMLLNGLKYLGEHPDFDFGAYWSNPKVFGFCVGEGELAEELDKAVCEGIAPTGAMHHAVISHLTYIHRNGYDSWIAECGKNEMTISERLSEDEIDNILLIADIEWQLKLDRGYDPLAVPLGNTNLIKVDPTDPESVRNAIERIAQIVKGE